MSVIPPPLTEAQARALMSSGLGKAELEFVVSFTASLFWIMRESNGTYRVHNGTAFFLDAGEGVFAVTANHVIEEWRRDQSTGNVMALQVGDLPVDFAGRNAIIAAHDKLDIATFRIAPEDVTGLGKRVLTGYQRQWPPSRPQEGRGLYFGGFPRTETIWLSPGEISFGAAPGHGDATSISETDVSILIDRQKLIPLLGAGVPPENYCFSGMSGGPVLAVIEHRGLRSWSLAGTIYEGPNSSPDTESAIAGLEIIKARRAHFILPDGKLDIARWRVSSSSHFASDRQ